MATGVRNAFQLHRYAENISDVEQEIFRAERFLNEMNILVNDAVNGQELAKRTMALKPELRVLFMSGYTDDAIIHQ